MEPEECHSCRIAALESYVSLIYCWQHFIMCYFSVYNLHRLGLFDQTLVPIAISNMRMPK